MRLAVIGAMGAGLSAALRARRVDRSLDITVVERGDVISYAACGLPYYVEGRVGSIGELTVHTPDTLLRERNIKIRTSATVSEIRHPQRELLLDGGERVAYDRLIVAAGARPNRDALGSTPAASSFTLHTLGDAVGLRTFIETQHPKRAVVVGAGYIGLEAADVLRVRGLEVSVVESSGGVLGHQDAELTNVVREELNRAGIGLMLDTPASEVGPDRVNGIACDLVVAAAGIRPNVELAAEAGVRLGATGAFAVDERMETSVSGIYDAGDCAEALHLLTGRPAYVPLGTTANRMGRVAGACAAGGRDRFRGIVGTSILRVCKLGVAVTGLLPAEARKEGFDPEAVRIDAMDHVKYFKGRPTTVYLVGDRRTHRVLGGWVTGEAGVPGRINLIAAAITSRMTLEDFEQLDLAYTPPYSPARDPVQVAANELLKLLD